MTETEIFKAIESRYGSGTLMAFADLIESENMKTTTHLDITESSTAFCVHEPCRVIIRGHGVGNAFEGLEAVRLEQPKQEVEWKNGDECIHKGELFYFIGEIPLKETNLNGECVIQHNGGAPMFVSYAEISKPKSERELVIEHLLKALDKMKGTKTHEVIEQLYDLGMLKSIQEG